MPPAGKEGSALSALSRQGDDPPGPCISFAGSTATVQSACKKALKRAKPRFRAFKFLKLPDSTMAGSRIVPRSTIPTYLMLLRPGPRFILAERDLGGLKARGVEATSG